MADGVSVVDLSAVSKGGAEAAVEAATAEVWGQAMRSAGFAIVTGHGVELGTMDAAFAAAKRFFERPASDKARYNFGAYGNSCGGYTAQGVEAVARSLANAKAPADLVESYVLSDTALEAPSLHEPDVLAHGKAYYEQATRLMHLLHRLSALALGLAPDYFEAFYDPPSNSLRMAHYPPLPEDTEEGQMRYGPHKDYEGFTILAVEDDHPSGLEVFLDGSWVPVRCPRGALVVNVGLFITYWTSGEWRSTLHRVANPPKGSAAARAHRYTLPFFTAPRMDVEVRPIRGGGSEPPINPRQHLEMLLQASNL